MSDESPEVQRWRLKEKQRVRRTCVRLAEGCETMGLEARIATASIQNLNALVENESRLLLEEILDHPDLLAVEDYGFRWYEDDAPQA